MISYFFILNSSGSMIYSFQRDCKLETNKLLVICSSLYSIRHMVNEISSKRHTEHFYFEEKIISMYSTLTGTTFVFVATENVDSTFRLVYGDYCKFVMLDPFYVLNMPVNSDKFMPEKYFK